MMATQLFLQVLLELVQRLVRLVDDTASADTLLSPPKLTVHTESILKCDPRTVMSISFETTPLAGVTSVTVGKASYAK